MSFQIRISPNRRAASKFIDKARRKLVSALADNPDVTRAEIANRLGVHRSVITKQLNGHADMSMGRAGEIAWALGYVPSLELTRCKRSHGVNISPAPVPAATVTVKTYTSSSTGAVKPLTGAKITTISELETA